MKPTSRNSSRVLLMFTVVLSTIFVIASVAHQKQLESDPAKAAKLVWDLYDKSKRGTATESGGYWNAKCLDDLRLIDNRFGAISTLKIKDVESEGVVGLPIKVEVDVMRSQALTTEIVTLDRRYHASAVTFAGWRTQQ
ncbi:MAG TPA: hypothetical protein VK171_11885 [Fimbriimonas sp.]|nr:hypothetical protein [Fimbriimonas sp.]